MVGLCVIALVVSIVQFMKTREENQRLLFSNTVFVVEQRILKDEISTLNRKPTYEQGYRDALVRIGGPTQPGAYQDGWEAAMKVVGEGTYADGYHSAIQQFGYQKANTSEYLISLNKDETTIAIEKPTVDATIK